MSTTEIMEFNETAHVADLAKGLFSTVRVGRKWADLCPGDALDLACMDGNLQALVLHVEVGELPELARSHSAMDSRVRGERNPATREAAMMAGLGRLYGVDPEGLTGVAVYLMPRPEPFGIDLVED